MDLVNLKDDIKVFNETTIPLLEKALTNKIEEAAKRLEGILDRIDGAEITVTVKLKPKEG